MSSPNTALKFNWPEEEPVSRRPNHPVDVSLTEAGSARRVWAIPVFGFFAKTLLLIPHWICLISLGWLAGFSLYWYWGEVLREFFSGSLQGSGSDPVQRAGVGFLLLGATQLVLWVFVLFDGG